MKRFLFIATAFLFLIPAEGSAQKWLKNLEKVGKTVDNVLGGTKTTTSDNSSNSQLKIVTNHPDLSVKLKRCSVSGRTCVLDLLITNTGNTDVSVRLAGGEYGSFAFDNEGNEYNKGLLSIQIGNSRLTENMLDVSPLLSNSPVKAKIQIEGIPEEATMFTRIQLDLACDAFGLNRNKNKLVMFYNIPISRDNIE